MLQEGAWPETSVPPMWPLLRSPYPPSRGERLLQARGQEHLKKRQMHIWVIYLYLMFLKCTDCKQAHSLNFQASNPSPLHVLRTSLSLSSQGLRSLPEWPLTLMPSPCWLLRPPPPLREDYRQDVLFFLRTLMWTCHFSVYFPVCVHI